MFCPPYPGRLSSVHIVLSYKRFNVHAASLNFLILVYIPGSVYNALLCLRGIHIENHTID